MKRERNEGFSNLFRPPLPSPPAPFPGGHRRIGLPRVRPLRASDRFGRLSRRCLGRLLERRKDGQPAPEEPQESALPEEAEEAPLPESVPWMLDVRGSCLRRDGKTVIGLSRQQAFLLRLFLEAETRPLSVLSIGLSLWPQDADAYALQDRTYTLVCRLRSSLHAAGMEIVKEQDGYRLYGNLALAE